MIPFMNQIEEQACEASLMFQQVYSERREERKKEEAQLYAERRRKEGAEA